VTLISAFSFCTDTGSLLQSAVGLLPSRWQEKLPVLRERLRSVGRRYLRAYLVLFSVTFSLLLIGFFLLRADYAFLLALLVTVIDFLPLLGVGCVLLPWGLILLLLGQYVRGVGMLLLYLVIAVVHQLLEPHLIGKTLGLPTVVTLLATYAGYRLLGIPGMLLGPPIACGIRLFLPSPTGSGKS
jgi:sporulation integral membrane protein YtvI